MTILNDKNIQQALDDFSGWNYASQALHKTFQFSNFYETMAFVNTVAGIAHQQNHHPDIALSYKTCTLRYSTHSAQGITQLDLEALKAVERMV